MSRPLRLYIVLILRKYLAQEHFSRQDVDFLDFFMPVHFSSASRARAFLWLAFRYYEGASPNPFDDDIRNTDSDAATSATNSRPRPAIPIPRLVELTSEEFELENVDTEEEQEYGAKMRKFRLEFLAKNAEGAAAAAASTTASANLTSASAPPAPMPSAAAAAVAAMARLDDSPDKRNKGKGKGKKPLTNVHSSARGTKRAFAEIEPKREPETEDLFMDSDLALDNSAEGLF
jgi:Ino eighty subunit 1